jgi:hypothetical protein
VKTIGALIAATGAVLFVISNGNHSACSSAWVYLLNTHTCANANHLYSVGITLIIAGSLMLILGALRHNPGSR